MPHQVSLFCIKYFNMDIFFGIIFGAFLSYFGITFYKRKSGKEIAEKQSVILLEKIKNVCKLVTVEGEFSEVYHYEDVKERFMSLISSKKKAIILVNAKVQVGYDLSKIKLESNPKTRTIYIHDFPQAEVIAVETDLKYYDTSEGFFNKFDASDLTELSKEAKQFIIDKIPESSLVESANKEFLEAIGIIRNIVETIGWKLDYEALKIEAHIQLAPKDK